MKRVAAAIAAVLIITGFAHAEKQEIGIDYGVYNNLKYVGEQTFDPSLGVHYSFFFYPDFAIGLGYAPINFNFNIEKIEEKADDAKFTEQARVKAQSLNIFAQKNFSLFNNKKKNSYLRLGVEAMMPSAIDFLTNEHEKELTDYYEENTNYADFRDFSVEASIYTAYGFFGSIGTELYSIKDFSLNLNIAFHLFQFDYEYFTKGKVYNISKTRTEYLNRKEKAFFREGLLAVVLGASYSFDLNNLFQGKDTYENYSSEENENTYDQKNEEVQEPENSIEYTEKLLKKEKNTMQPSITVITPKDTVAPGQELKVVVQVPVHLKIDSAIASVDNIDPVDLTMENSGFYSGTITFPADYPLGTAKIEVDIIDDLGSPYYGSTDVQVVKESKQSE